jgi:hypothetical protein
MPMLRLLSSPREMFPWVTIGPARAIPRYTKRAGLSFRGWMAEASFETVVDSLLSDSSSTF